MRAKCALIGFCLASEALFAADALGVTRPTLYAYTSRGQLQSEPAPGRPRERRYYREDIERLRARKVESAWQPGVVSSKGAMGLMQLMPATAEHFGVSHPFFIDENIRGGVAYLAELKHLFHGDLRLVMGAYAAGERPIMARGLNYSSPEVYAYVQRIAEQYRAELRRVGRR